MKKALKRIFCLGLVLVFMLTSANVAFAVELKFPEYPNYSEYNLSFPVLYNSTEGTSTAKIEDYIDVKEFNKYMVEQLKQKQCITENYEPIAEINVSKFNIPIDMAEELSQYIWYNMPELFNIDGMGATERSGYVYTIDFTTRFTKEEYVRKYSEMVKNAEIMLKDIKGNETLSDVEKALLLHDRLATFCEYDYANFIKGQQYIPESSYIAYGALGDGVAVCMGYALAYDYLLEQVDIKSEYCSSRALNHAWNIVYIDNTPYHVDVTWDDPTWDVSGKVVHENFLRSTEGIIETGHRASDYISTPTDTTYDSAFWQSSETAFQTVDGKIYYIDNNEGKLLALDDISDTTSEMLVDLSGYVWRESASAYWGGNYSRLTFGRDLLFYSTPQKVYSYNPKTNASEVVIEPDFNGWDYYNIFGLTYYRCTLWGEASNAPYYNEETKRNFPIVKGYHNPTENWQVVITPTHTSQGKEKDYCIDCGAEKGSRIIPASADAHIWSNWYIDVNNPPTCVDKGVELRDCAHCDAFEWRYGTALGHDFQKEYTIDVEPTELQEGLKSRHCTRCDAVTDPVVIPVKVIEHTHTYTATVTKQPTCKEKGIKTFTCSCGASYTEEMPIVSHAIVVIPAVAPTYKEVGKTEGRKCAVCGLVTQAPTDVAKLVLGVPAVKIANSAKGITVTWNAVEGAESYVVYRRTYNPSTKKYSGWTTLNGAYTSTSFTDTTVVLGTTYSYTVRAVNSGVKSAYKATSGLKYNVTPTVKISNATNGIKVTWTTAANADGYRVYRSTYNSKTKKWSSWKNMGTAKATATSWTDKSVSNNTYYKYTVRAVEGKFLSNYKASSQTRFFKVPTVKIANNASGIKVSWNKISGATGYTVYSSEYVNGKWSSWKNRGTAKSTTTSWTDKKVKSGVKYKYTVRAVNGSYKSAYVSSSTLLYLAQPTVTVANASNGIKVSWTQSEGATGYTVYSSTYNTKTKKWSSWSNRGTAKATSKSWTDKKAKKGTTYRYTVRAVNGSAKSTYTASSSIKR